MPNWCNNYMVVKPLATPISLRTDLLPHEKSRLNKDYLDKYQIFKKFRDIIIADDNLENPLGFNAFIPRPPEEENNWYDWNVSNWGTKWSITDWGIYTTDDEDEVRCGFDTAWSPPEAFVKKLSLKFPDLYVGIDWEEPGMDYAGYFLYLNGKVLGIKDWGMTAWARQNNCLITDEDGYEEIDWEVYNDLQTPSCQDLMGDDDLPF